MLKARTKQINPFSKILQKIIKEDEGEDNDDDTYEHKEPSSDKRLVYAEVPNYLERPIFSHAKPMLICMFQIRMDGLYPYLLFLLHKNKRKTMFNFVNFPSFDGGKVSTHLKKEAVNYMTDKFVNIKNVDISYAGFTENETNNILILKYVENTQNETTHTDSIMSVPTDDYCWVSTHELINLKTIMKQPFAIAPSVFNFFIKNPAFLLLRNDKEVIYETPVIGYYTFAKGALTDIFRETLRNDIGSCYYFYVEPPKKNDGEDIIIMRSLLFLGRLGLIEKIKNINVCDSFLLTTDDHVKMYAINRYSQHLPLSYT